MNIVIQIGEDARTVLVLPVECAGAAAQIMAQGKVFERDGYYANSGWVPAKTGVQISYKEGSEFAPTDPKVAELSKQLQDKNSEWAKEYNARRELEAKVASLQSTIETMTSAVPCAMRSESTAAET